MSAKLPFPHICIALGFPDRPSLLDHACKEIESGESFLEFRLDYLSDAGTGVDLIGEIRRKYPHCSVLATCRRHQNHGKFNGSIDQQIQILAAAVEAGACAVDVEIESAEQAASRLDVFRGRALLIVSYHNYDGTPALESVLRRMTRVPADAYKVVTTARKPSDNARVLDLAKTHNRTPLIVLAMGETGFPTRVLSPAFGGLYTYAAPNSAEGTAAGQASARQLRHVYRIDKFTRNAQLYGVMADPVRHSISPAVHNRAFQARRIDAVYLPFLVQPPQLKDFFSFAEKLPVTGLSVTIPHKQKVIRYLDIVDPLARRIGAVNTVWRKGGKWRGTNTDAPGVTAPLARSIRLSKSTVLVVGNGGAARGAAYALKDAGAKVSITGRNLDRVRALAKSCNAEPLSSDQAKKLHFDALVHATSLGMYPDVNSCFFESNVPADVVFDMVYNPLETALTKLAAGQGRTVIPGLEMFLEQAAQQFEIWTGESAPRAVMERAAIEALAAKVT